MWKKFVHAMAAAALCAQAASADEGGASMYRGGPAHSGTYAGERGTYLTGLQWRVQTHGAIRSSPVIDGNDVFVGSSDGKLYAIALATGDVRWAYDAASAITSSPAVDGANVYFGSYDGVMRAIDRRTGSLRWAMRTGTALPFPWGHESGDFWTASPTIANGLLYAGAGDGFLYALDAKSGRTVWKAHTGGRIRSAPALSADTAYIGSYDGYLYAFSRGDGAQRWRFATEGAHLRSADFGYDRRSIASSPSLGDGAVYFGSKDGAIYAVEAESGKLRWRKPAEVYWYLSAPAFDRHRVYTGNSDARFVQAIDTATGNEAWHFDTKINVFASPSVSGGVVYTGTWDGVFYALDEESGKELWHYKTAGRRIFSSAAIARGHVIFGSDDGAIYALNVSSTTPLERAVFYDATLQPFNMLPAATDLRDYLAARDYTLLGAAELAAFLAARIADRKPSVVVFAMDSLPRDVTSGGKASLFRRYLDAGGRIVWTSRPPLLWNDKPVEQLTLSDLDRSRPRELLGVSFERGTFDPMTATVTREGRRWGLADHWLSAWPADPQTVTSILARDEQGNAAAWIRSYGGARGTGFVEVPLVTSPQRTALNFAEIEAAAQYRPQ